MSANKALRFKAAADKVKFQSRPGPALLVVSEPNSPATTPRKQSPRKSLSDPKSFRSQFATACRKAYRRMGLKHFGFMVITIMYAFFGGWLFSLLEKQNEIDTKADTKQQLYNESFILANKLLNICGDPSIVNKTTTMYNTISVYQQSKGLFPKEGITWDLWGGMFFAGTVFTTIGYGHYAPVTKGGRIAVMLYALIGIPMVLAMLTDFGKWLTKVLNHLWSLFRRGLSKLISVLFKRDLKVTNANVADAFDFPIPLAVFLILSWILMCSAIFRIWEDWSYFKAFYFFFISLTTVGLGDVVPDHPKYMIVMFPLVIIGLSLVSLVINLIQNKLEKLKEQTTGFVENQFGFDVETESEEEETENKGAVPGEDVSKTANIFNEKQRTAMGIIQTMQKQRSRRRRIGVQTEDWLMYDKVATVSDGVVTTNDRTPLLFQKLRKHVNKDSDETPANGSIHTLFYDTQSSIV